MANRVIREGWLTSGPIDRLDVREERFFLRLILVVDDWGRTWANPEFLARNCFPLDTQNGLRRADLARWLDVLETYELIRRYSVVGRDGTPEMFLEICRFRNPPRHVRSKFPAPPWGSEFPEKPRLPRKSRGCGREVCRTDTLAIQGGGIQKCSTSSEVAGDVRSQADDIAVPVRRRRARERGESTGSIRAKDDLEYAPFVGEVDEIPADHSKPKRARTSRRERWQTRYRAEVKIAQEPMAEWESPQLIAQWKKWVNHLEAMRGPMNTPASMLNAQKRHLNDILLRRGEKAALDALEWPMRNGRSIPMEPPKQRMILDQMWRREGRNGYGNKKLRRNSPSSFDSYDDLWPRY